MGTGVDEPVRVLSFIDLDLIPDTRCVRLTESVQVPRTVDLGVGDLTMSFVCKGSVQGDGAAFESHVLKKLMNWINLAF